LLLTLSKAALQKKYIVIALCCETASAGSQSWSVRLLADRFVILETGEKVGRETIRRPLKK